MNFFYCAARISCSLVFLQADVVTGIGKMWRKITLPNIEAVLVFLRLFSDK